MSALKIAMNAKTLGMHSDKFFAKLGKMRYLGAK